MNASVNFFLSALQPARASRELIGPSPVFGVAGRRLESGSSDLGSPGASPSDVEQVEELNNGVAEGDGAAIADRAAPMRCVGSVLEMEAHLAAAPPCALYGRLRDPESSEMVLAGA